MQANKSTGTKPETILAKTLFARGHRYRKNNKSVFGKPDLTFKKIKLAIFVDGEFWHGKDWHIQKDNHKTNRDFWISKIERNIERDKEVNEELTRKGWTVLRFWGKEIEQNLLHCVTQIENEINGLKMKFKDKISIEVIDDKQFKIRLVEPEDNKEAILTHYMHNLNSNVSKFYKVDAVEFAKEILEYKYPNEEITTQVAEEALQYGIFHTFEIPFLPKEETKFTFIDLFAGIGGFRLAFQNLGGKCVFTSEWDNFAKKTYKANFGELPFGDITKINESFIPDHDILLAGFPCQPFSIAGVSKKNALGKRHGFLDETQGTLFFDIARILEHKKPRAFMLENVKNLVSHDKGKTFKIIKNTLEELGYSIHYQVLNGKHFVPQNRERIFIIGFKNSIYKGNENFVFPELPEPKTTFKEILDDGVEGKYTLSDKLWNYLQDYSRKHKAKGNGFGFGLTDLNGISRTLSARYYKDGSEILIPQDGKNPRRLTPRECARLQGFPDTFIIPVSDNQAYKQFGNAVTVPLIQTVGKQLVKSLLSINGKHSKQSNTFSSAV